MALKGSDKHDDEDSDDDDNDDDDNDHILHSSFWREQCGGLQYKGLG